MQAESILWEINRITCRSSGTAAKARQPLNLTLGVSNGKQRKYSGNARSISSGIFCSGWCVLVFVASDSKRPPNNIQVMRMASTHVYFRGFIKCLILASNSRCQTRSWSSFRIEHHQFAIYRWWRRSICCFVHISRLKINPPISTPPNSGGCVAMVSLYECNNTRLVIVMSQSRQSFTPNSSVKRDCAKARSPLLLR